MRRKTFIFSLIYILIFLSAFSLKSFYTAKDQSPIVYKKGDLYLKEWKEVDSLDRKALPKSALELTKKIYAKAKAEDNIPQVVKALLHEAKFSNAIEEDGLIKAIHRFEGEIENSKTPLKQILHSVNASMYLNYFEKNRWSIYNRTETEATLSNDIKTWTAKQISNKVIEQFELSMASSDSLQRISIGTIEPIILSSNDNYDRTWPTLYDFLAYRTANAYANDMLSIVKVEDHFKMDDRILFAPYHRFADVEIPTDDSSSLKYKQTIIIQELLKFHEQIENPDALIDADLYRLKMVYKMSTSKQKDDYYIEALERLLNQFSKVKHADYIRVQLAEVSQNVASRLTKSPNESEAFKKYNTKALKYIEAIKQRKKPDSLLVQKCDYLLNKINQSNLKLEAEAIVLPDEAFPISITAKNVASAQLKIFKLDRKAKERIESKRIYGLELYKALAHAGESISDRAIDLNRMNDYQEHRTELIVKPLSKGLYVMAVEAYTKEKDTLSVDYAYIRATNIALLQNSEDDKIEIQVLHRKTGEALGNATVNLWYSDYSYEARRSVKRKAGTYTTDKKGWFSTRLSKNKNILVDVEFQDDYYASDDNLYIYKPYQTKARPQTYFFTDRKIYRPGQTVYFKAIQIQREGDQRKIQAHQELEVIFYDVNYQKVASQKLKTNAYGSVNGKFEIPKHVLTGQMHLKTKYGNVYFNVEEYKRPQFEVKLDKFEGYYKFNETVEVKGKAKGFAGHSISGAKFVYRVVKQANYRPYWSYVREPSQEIANGTGLTDETGAFKFNFEAEADLESEKTADSYTYTLYVDVTDISGETHSTTGSITVGKKALNLSLSLPSVVLSKALDKAKIMAKNLNGEPVESLVKYEVLKLQSHENLKKNRYWAEPDMKMLSESDWEKQLPNYNYSSERKEAKVLKSIASGEIKTKTEAVIDFESMDLKEGLYRVKMSAKDAFGNLVESKKDFTVLNVKSKRMPKLEKNLFKVLKTKLEPGEELEILLGSSFEDVKVLLEIDRKNQERERRFVKLDNEKKVIRIPVKESDRGNFHIHTSFVYENRIYQNEATITVPHSNKKLDIAFETFRNKLYPGQKETWKLKIKGAKGEKIAAEFLASMYDASLDAFVSQAWNFNILDSYYGKSRMNAQGFASIYAYNLYRNNSYVTQPIFTSPELNWFGFNPYNRYRNRYAFKGRSEDVELEAAIEEMHSTSVVREQVVYDVPMIKDKESHVPPPPPLPGATGLDEMDSIEGNGNEGIEQQKSSKPAMVKLKIRKNFNETAFFLPELQTDEEGNVIFKFTMPESLTEWNFKGFAHTQDLKYGFIDETIVTQKDLMVFPNAPRFFREGDKISLPVKVSNLTQEKQRANASIRFYNVDNGQEITSEIYPDFKNHVVEIDAKGSAVFVADLSIPENYGAISYKVIASTGKFADGEEKAIPVLSNRMLVTESMPLSIRKKGTKTFEFDKLINQKSSTLKHYNYTLEMTSNPAWYAVQALPYLAEYPYECAEQTFSRFYANTLAAHIANSNPKIKTVFEQWKNAPSKESLLSNLEKNQELKALLIQESPWLVEAKDESEQKRRIAELFNLNELASNQVATLRQLKEMQLSSGAWPWFKGMRENRYITQLIVSGLGRLEHIGAIDLNEDATTREMLRKAMLYLDRELARDYKNLLKNVGDKERYSNSYTNQTQLQYLYARTFFKDRYPVAKSTEKAYEYYSLNAMSFWTEKSKYMQAMIGLIANREAGKNKAKYPVQSIVKSLKEHALNSEEMGMYWKSSPSYYWYQSPIERQSIIIELFTEVGGEEAAAEEAKIWLLKQKQTQNWKTTRATTDAIYALLMNGTDLLAKTDMVEVKIASERVKVDESKTEAGTGYYKTTWSAEEIKPEMGKVELKQSSNSLAWGAVYWQYFEDMDKIQPHKTPLHIEKQLMVSENTASGPVLKSIDNSAIKVGDKLVVRITLRVDRDMEYVHMKDKRASGLEPINVISSYKYKNGLGYYESTKDASTNFFFDYLRKGTYVFEYPLRAVHQGDFSNGITTIQCMYAPEFTSHSEGLRISIDE